MGQIEQLITEINEKTVNAPVGWQDTQIKATFDNEAQQANISTTEFTFVLQSAEEVYAWIESGYMFEGIPIELSIQGETARQRIFKGYIDTTKLKLENYPVGINRPVKIRGNIEEAQGLVELEKKLASINYGYLYDEGVITDSDFLDFPYVIEKPFNVVEVAILSITIYLMIKEIQETILRITEQVSIIAGILSAGVTGSIGALIVSAATLIANAAYAAIMTVQLKNLFTELLTQFISPVRNHKVSTYHTLLSKACEKLGFGFETGLPLNNVIYLASSRGEGKPIKKGIPSPNDYGYSCAEMFELAIDQFDAKIAVVNDVVQLRWVDDPYWIKTSTYKMPSIKLESKRYNTDDMIGSITVSYATDPNDNWTVDNYNGNSAILQQSAKRVKNKKNVLIKGYQKIQLSVAHATRKDELSALEELIKEVGGIVDSVVNVFGGNSNLAGRVKNRVGMAKMSEPSHSVPKSAYMVGGKLPKNHREKIGAETLIRNYHIRKSLSYNNFERQRAVYEDIKIPFSLVAFRKLINNSYFTTADGKIGKFISVDWNISGTFATASFWIRERYTDNLQHKIILPD